MQGSGPPGEGSGLLRAPRGGLLLHSLVDVGDGVHPAAHPHLVAHVGGVAELVDDADVVGVGPTEDLLLQSQRVHLATQSFVSTTDTGVGLQGREKTEMDQIPQKCRDERGFLHK